MYVSEYNANRITKISPDGTGSVVASLSSRAYDLAFDSTQNLYATLNSAGQIVRISSDGTTTVGEPGLNSPLGIAFDSNDNLYVAEGTGQISTIDNVGNRTALFSLGGARDLFYDEVSGLLLISSQQLGIWTYDINANTGIARQISEGVYSHGSGSSPVGGSFGVTADAAGNVFYAGFPSHMCTKSSRSK